MMDAFAASSGHDARPRPLSAKARTPITDRFVPRRTRLGPVVALKIANTRLRAEFVNGGSPARGARAA